MPRNPRLPGGPTMADFITTIAEVRREHADIQRRVTALEAALEAPPNSGATRTAREELEYWWEFCSYEEKRQFLLDMKFMGLKFTD